LSQTFDSASSLIVDNNGLGSGVEGSRIQWVSDEDTKPVCIAAAPASSSSGSADSAAASPNESSSDDAATEGSTGSVPDPDNDIGSSTGSAPDTDPSMVISSSTGADQPTAVPSSSAAPQQSNLTVPVVAFLASWELYAPVLQSYEVRF